MRRNQVVGILLSASVLLAVLAILVVVINPFRTLPTVKVVDASWELTTMGYALLLAVEATGRLQLVAIDVGDTVYRVAYDIVPPRSNLTIPLPVPKPQRQVTLHFDVLSPVGVSARYRQYSSRVDAAAGESRLFLVGTVAQEASLVALQVQREPSVAILIYWRVYKMYVSRLHDAIPASANVSYIYVPSKEAVEAIERYRTLVFVEIAPEPTLLADLVKRGKNVVVHYFDDTPGRVRFRLVNGTIEEVVATGESPESDYFGIPCARRQFELNLISNVKIVDEVVSWLGAMQGQFPIVESPYYRLFHEVYVKSEHGDVYLGRTLRGFYYSSVSLEHLVMLALIGFFDAGGKLTYESQRLPPFRGVRLLNLPAVPTLVTVHVGGEGLFQRYVSPQPIQFSVKGDTVVISLGVDKHGRRVWNGTASVKIHEVTYGGELSGIPFEGVVGVPTVLDVPRTAYRALLVYVDGRLAAVVADETAADQLRVSISNSEVCEVFYLTVTRSDRVNTPLFLYVNGRRTALIEPEQSFTMSECVPGFYSVEVRNVYGDVVASKSFRAVRIYEQPLFMLSLLMVAGVSSTVYWTVKRRAVKEVDYVTLVMYRLPERGESVVSVDGLVDLIDKIYVKKKLTPTVKELVEHAYRRKPVMKTVTEVFEILRHLPSKRKDTFLYSRYLPEVDDIITLVGKGKLASGVRDFYTHAILEVMKKLGGTPVPKEYIKDVVDVDAAILLGDCLLLITYAPCVDRPDADIRNAIDRAISSFMLIRRLRLPFRPIGFAVLTEPRYVRLVNRHIDDILSGNREVAARLLRDMSVFQRIVEAPKDAWLGRYVMVAAPLTRIAPLFAFVKLRAPKLCNHYYRFARFSHE